MYAAPKTPFVCLRTLQAAVAKEAKRLEKDFGINNLYLPVNWYAMLVCANFRLIERAIVVDGVIKFKRDEKYYSDKIAFVAKMFERQFAKIKKGGQAVAA